MHATLPLLKSSDFPAMSRRRLDTLQVNLGYRCNQACLHCHVNAGPTRTEEMTREIVDVVIAFVRASRVGLVDITGGAPELNPHFRLLVDAIRDQDVRVRSNLWKILRSRVANRNRRVTMQKQHRDRLALGVWEQGKVRHSNRQYLCRGRLRAIVSG